MHAFCPVPKKKGDNDDHEEQDLWFCCFDSVVWGMQATYQQAAQDRKRHAEALQQLKSDSDHGFKRRKADDGRPLIELPLHFDKYLFYS